MQIRLCFESIRFEIFLHFSCLLANFIIIYIELCFYMGLLQFAPGLSKTKDESPKDSYSAKQRENPVGVCVELVRIKHHFQQSFSHIKSVSGCNRGLNAHFYGAASLWL